MKKRSLFLIGAVEAIMLLVGVYFEPTFCVRGHLHSEAFFDGKSTSWWRQELERWEVATDTVYSAWHGRRVHVHQFERNASWYEEWQGRWLPAKPASTNEGDDVAEIMAWDAMVAHGPRLLHGEPEAIPVLQELLDDPSPKIRQFARIGLKMDEEAP